MRSRPAAHPLLMMFCWFMTVFLVLFPKGGIKVGGVPLTWGYLFVGLTVPLVAAVRMLALSLRLPLRLLAALAMFVPMQALYVYATVVNGVAIPALAVSNFVSFFFLPWTFLLIYAAFLPMVDGAKLSAYMRICILLAALWGILLFIQHPLTGHFFEIPYLTVNAADYGEIELTKHIARGLFFKLISTYNNGNLYGVATLILLPLYELLEKVRWRRMVVKLAILLTLSRTVWAGLVLYELMPLLILLARQWRTFPRVHLDKIGTRIGVLVVTAGLIFAGALFNYSISAALAFLLDPGAGGRTDELKFVGALTVLPSRGVGGFGELSYLSALNTFGYSGLAAFVLLMGSPVLLLLVDRRALASPARGAALKGLILYAFLGLLDGGFDLIPMMAFYWFVYMIYLFGWPRMRRGSAQPARRQLSRSQSSRSDASGEPVAAPVAG